MMLPLSGPCLYVYVQTGTWGMTRVSIDAMGLGINVKTVTLLAQMAGWSEMC